MATPIEAARIAATSALRLAALHAALTADLGAIRSADTQTEKVTGGGAEVPDPVAREVFAHEALHDRAREVEFCLSAVAIQTDAYVKAAEATLRAHGLAVPYETQEAA